MSTKETRARKTKSRYADSKYAGKKFGMLTAMFFVGVQRKDKYTDTIWRFSCDCGNEKDICIKHVLRKSKYVTKSCGCRKIKIIQDKHSCEKDANTKRAVRLYKYQAKKRGLIWELDYERTVSLLEGKCHYCKRLPAMIENYSAGADIFVRNGIDRIDSSIGYIEGNCVSCCKRCNRAKMDLTYDEFLELVSDIYKNLIQV